MTTPTPPRRMIALHFQPDQGIHKDITPGAISDALNHKESLIWLDITAPQPDDTRLLQEEFNLHPLALEELGAEHLRPKCTEFPGLYVMVMYAARFTSGERIRLNEVVIYIGQQFLITAHPNVFPEIDECVRRWRAMVALQGDTIAAPLYSLLDTLVDGYFPVVDQIAEDVEEVEDHLFAGDGTPQGTQLFNLKKDLLTLRRAVAGQRDALNLMLRQDVPLFKETSLLYFQSVYDHLVRLVESIDTYRDLLSSAMDLHLSVLSNRMNQVMKTLTVVSTILMSASLVTGVYGMNFDHMPELHTRFGYYFVLGGVVLIAGALAYYFRRIKWF